MSITNEEKQIAEAKWYLACFWNDSLTKDKIQLLYYVLIIDYLLTKLDGPDLKTKQASYGPEAAGCPTLV